MSELAVSRLCILVALGLGLPALGAERIAVVATGLETQGQLEEVLCVSQSCVPVDQVVSGGRVDPKKLAREGVKQVVLARRSAGGVDVEVKDASGQLRFEQAVKAGAGGRIAIGELVSVAARLLETIENGKPARLSEEQGKPKPAKLARADRRAKAAKKAKTKVVVREQRRAPRG